MSYFENDPLEETPTKEKALNLSRETINASVEKAFEAFEYLKSIKSNFSVLETAKHIIESIIQTVS